jgi:flagellar protein FliO/FliZ
MRCAVAIAASAALFAAPVFAAAPVDADIGVAGLGRVIGSLLVVIAIILASSWLLRRMPGASRSGARLRTLESVAVGIKERVVLVQAGERQLLLGIAPGSVRTLLVLEQPLAELPIAPSSTPAASFAALLRGVRGGKA